MCSVHKKLTTNLSIGVKYLSAINAGVALKIGIDLDTKFIFTTLILPHKRFFFIHLLISFFYFI